MLLVLCPLLVLVQTNNYVLTGKVGKLSAPAKAYLIFPAVNHVDSVVIKNGVFEFKGKLQNYYVARLVIDEKGSGYKRPAKVSYMSFYIEPGTTKITSPDSLSNAKVTAGKLNADNELLKADFLPYQKRMSSLMDDFFPAPKEKRIQKSGTTSIPGVTMPCTGCRILFIFLLSSRIQIHWSAFSHLNNTRAMCLIWLR